MILLCLTNDFWTNFWPNLASTLLGLIIGIPIALAINRKAEKEKNKLTIQNQLLNFKVAMDIINRAILVNKKRLAETKTILSQNNIQADTGLDISSWEVIRNDIIVNLKDPLLLQRIAFYYFKVANLKKNHNVYFSLIIGINSTVSGQELIKENLKQICINDAEFLVKESDKLLISLEKHKS
jgi:hypothetical protein